MQLHEILRINLERCEKWHKGGIEEWDINHWMVATLGELGEAANIVKKRNRVLMGAKNINDPGRQVTEVADADKKILEEIADTFFYLCLAGLRISSVEDFEKAIVNKFNSVSEKYGFSERLVVGDYTLPDGDGLMPGSSASFDHV